MEEAGVDLGGGGAGVCMCVAGVSMYACMYICMYIYIFIYCCSRVGNRCDTVNASKTSTAKPVLLEPK